MRDVGPSALPRTMATAVLAALLTAMTGCGGADDSTERITADPPSFQQPGIAAEIPNGWDATGHPMSALLDPEQLLIAGSFDLSPHGHLARGGSCSPEAAIDLRPDDGALVAVTEYSPGHLSPATLRQLPPRPRTFTLSPRNYGSRECSGESYDMQFREGGVGYKIDVWLDPDRASRQIRKDTLRLLNSLELRPGEDPQGAPLIRGFQAALVTPTAVRVSWRLDSPANLALIVEGLPGGAAGTIPFDAEGSYPDPTRSPSTSPTGRDEARVHFERGELNFSGSPRLRFSLRASTHGRHDQSGPVTLNRDGLFGRARVERAIRGLADEG